MFRKEVAVLTLCHQMGVLPKGWQRCALAARPIPAACSLWIPAEGGDRGLRGSSSAGLGSSHCSPFRILRATSVQVPRALHLWHLEGICDP